MFKFLLILQTLVSIALVTVILMQRSEGGGLGVGGSSSGLMTARGAADFLTRATAILATLFVLLAISLAAIAGVQRSGPAIDTSLARPGSTAPASSTPVPGQMPGAPATGAPIPGTQQAPAATTPAAPAPAQQAPAEKAK